MRTPTPRSDDILQLVMRGAAEMDEAEEWKWLSRAHTKTRKLERELAAAQARASDAVVRGLEMHARIETLERILGESYQVMGILADEAGRFDDPAVIKALDNASRQEIEHHDVLPFPCKKSVARDGGEVEARLRHSRKALKQRTSKPLAKHGSETAK